MHCPSVNFSPIDTINFSSSSARIDKPAVFSEKLDELNDELVYLNSVIDHDYAFDVERLTSICKLFLT